MKGADNVESPRVLILIEERWLVISISSVFIANTSGFNPSSLGESLDLDSPVAKFWWRWPFTWAFTTL